MSLSSTDISILDANDSSWGSCYTYTSAGDVACSHELKSNCGGYYIDGATCDLDTLPTFNKYETDFWISDPINTAEVSNVVVGSEFQGGLYCGQYIPSGLSFTDNINTIYSSDTTPYALILYNKIFKIKYGTKTSINPNTSNYNGRFNLILGDSALPDLNVDNIFKDWYYPSISELKFITNQYSKYINLRSKIIKMFIGQEPKNITSSSIFSIRAPIGAQRSSPLHQKYLYGTNLNYNTTVLINPNIISNLFCIRTIELI